MDVNRVPGASGVIASCRDHLDLHLKRVKWGYPTEHELKGPLGSTVEACRSGTGPCGEVNDPRRCPPLFAAVMPLNGNASLCIYQRDKKRFKEE